jgi:hypothetical protein
MAFTTSIKITESSEPGSPADGWGLPLRFSPHPPLTFALAVKPREELNMKCQICDSESSYYFSKTYTEPPFSDFMIEIGTVDYFKCSKCGFVISETHRRLDDAKWNKLNYQFHHHHENSGVDKEIHQPPYAEQAMMISFLGKNEIIDTASMIDYAGGYGRLSNILSKYYGLKLQIFDPYIQADNSGRYISRSELQSYNTVINSAMFEHVLSRTDLDRVNGIVDPDGCLIIHSVICENVPKDPNWFYLRPPVHTAFHTNKSMEILMEQWNYRSSIYSPKSKCWVLLRDNITIIKKTITRLNEELQSNWFYCKNGFVDYWKGF